MNLKIKKMKEKMLKQLFRIINKKDVISVIYYGNTNGDDIDLCVITNTLPIYEKKEVNKLDITIFNEPYFIYLIQLLDPLTSEPILTGQEIYGSNLKRYIKFLKKTKISKKTIEHLYDFSNQIFKASKKLYYEHKYHHSINNILFCLSYLAYANYYVSEKKVILFKELISNNNNTLLTEAYFYLKSNVVHQKERINYFITKTEMILKN